MAVWALLSISQTVKAVDFCIMGTFDGGNRDTWTRLDGKSMHPDGNNQYSQTYQCTKAGEYRFRFIGEGWKGEMCPELSSYNLTNASCKVYYTDQDGRKDNYFYVNMESGKTYTFTFDNSSESNRTVACTVSGEGSGTVTPIEKYCSFYLIGNLHSDEEWKDGTKANLFTTSDGKTYTYTFTGVGKTVYFRVQGYDSDGKQFEKDLAPDATENKSLTTTFETVVYKPYNTSPKAWYFDAKSDKTYTITLDYSDTSKPQIKYTEGGSSVVTKVIKLFNGSSELTGTNGKYTLDLSSATADATITLSIDGVPYGLATAQTISAVGTTSDIAFTAERTEKLTLKAGLIYSLTVTEDGKMTVEAKEKVNPYKVAGAGFYLVGDFMSPYNHSDVNPGGDIPGKINYERLYFKFEQQTDGSYKIDIPACLTAKMQILGISVDGVPSVYGPSDIVDLYGAKDHGTASPVTDGSVGGNSNTDNLVVVNDFNDQINYWNLVTRNDGVTDDDGIYEVSFTFDSDSKTPKIWTIKHNSLKRVMYLLSNAQGATAQPLYDSRSKIKDGYSDVSSASAVHLEGITSKYFVLGTVVRDLSNPDSKIYKQAIKADDGIHMISDEKGGKQCGTHTKFFFLGADPVYESDNPQIRNL